MGFNSNSKELSFEEMAEQMEGKVEETKTNEDVSSEVEQNKEEGGE